MRLNMIAGFAVLALSSAASAVVINETFQGIVPLPNTNGSTGLSGLTYAGGSQYYAVADGAALSVYPITINVDSSNGQITNTPSPDAPILLKDFGGAAFTAATDAEGIAYNAANSSVFVSFEASPYIGEFRLSDGRQIGEVTVPGVYSNVVGNRGLEALALQANGALYTSNEEALTTDGPVSTTADGTVTRIQQFDVAGNPTKQVAYKTEPIRFALIGGERSGVAEMVALPGGEVVVMEREAASLIPPFRHNFYEVDFSGAADTTLIADASTAVPANKTLRRQLLTTSQNYEGAALGSQLDDGSFSLILISDDGGGLDQTLYPLTITPEPATLSLLAGASLLLRRRRRA